jgi:hypothetical protein
VVDATCEEDHDGGMVRDSDLIEPIPEWTEGRKGECTGSLRFINLMATTSVSRNVSLPPIQ